MTKITNKYRSALTKMLNGMTMTMPKGMLTFGQSTVSGNTFCRVISPQKAISRLLSCTDLEIKGVAFFYDVQAAFVAFLKKVLPQPSKAVWWNLCNNENWLRYNISAELFCLHLWDVNAHYYILITHTELADYRAAAF